MDPAQLSPPVVPEEHGSGEIGHEHVHPHISLAVGFVTFILLLFLAGLGGYYIGLQKYNTVASIGSTSPKEKACTLDAMECPDGSFVGRSGPRCEFAPCPTIVKSSDTQANWKDYTNP